MQTTLSDYDLYLIGEGTHNRAYERLGAHLTEIGGRRGVQFAVWAPNASYVSVFGDLNGWDYHASPLNSRGQSGIWEGFLPDVKQGPRYQYRIESQSYQHNYQVDKADPYGFAAELRPSTAS